MKAYDKCPQFEVKELAPPISNRGLIIIDGDKPTYGIFNNV
jgi:hypothetical protein